MTARQERKRQEDDNKRLRENLEKAKTPQEIEDAAKAIADRF